MTDTYDQAQLKELLVQMVETELGGEQVYLQALESMVNDDLRKEWQGYLEETLRHQDILRRVCDALDIDESEQSPGRQVVAHIGQSLVVAMRIAREAGDPEAAERVACECVVLAETKDHSNWDLLGASPTMPTEVSATCCRLLAMRWRRTKTTTSITRWAGAGSCGFRRWACPPFCPRPRRKSTSKLRSAPHVPNSSAKTCSDNRMGTGPSLSAFRLGVRFAGLRIKPFTHGRLGRGAQPASDVRRRFRGECDGH